MRRRRKDDPQMQMVCVEEGGQPLLYLTRNGIRIARGHPDTPHARSWISLEPGSVVRDVGYYEGIEVEYLPWHAISQ
jgi:hypothetical protein